AARLREVVDDPDPGPILGRPFRGEVDDVARSIERLHAAAMHEKALSSEHRVAMNQIVDSFGEGLIAISPNGRIVFANRRVAEIVGSPVELVGRSILEVIRKPSIPGALSRALGGESCTERVAIEGVTSERRVEIRFFPVAASAEIAAVALLIDVTTVERLQRMRTDFLDDFSHEVRTPLAGLRSAAETLQHGGLRREDESQLRNVVFRQIARIERLVTDLSDLNQIESGRIELRREHVSLHDLLGGLCEDVRERAGPPAAQLMLRDGDATADVDPARVTQIFSNLLDNAIKHGGGRGEILVAVTRENGEAVVCVSDSGDGIPPAELDRIFNRFYRVDRSRSQAIPGSGLGLAIAKHLTLLHGGAIRAYNRESGGATFEVRLPAV
ncbi:MAG: ATP-binding protein, partial [Thermoanaerobaculia bacterium]